jgi:hypothetical protein
MPDTGKQPAKQTKTRLPIVSQLTISLQIFIPFPSDSHCQALDILLPLAVLLAFSHFLLPSLSFTALSLELS